MGWGESEWIGVLACFVNMWIWAWIQAPIWSLGTLPVFATSQVWGMKTGGLGGPQSNSKFSERHCLYEVKRVKAQVTWCLPLSSACMFTGACSASHMHITHMYTTLTHILIHTKILNAYCLIFDTFKHWISEILSMTCRWSRYFWISPQVLDKIAFHVYFHKACLKSVLSMEEFLPWLERDCWSESCLWHWPPVFFSQGSHLRWGVVSPPAKSEACFSKSQVALRIA